MYSLWDFQESTKRKGKKKFFWRNEAKNFPNLMKYTNLKSKKPNKFQVGKKIKDTHTKTRSDQTVKRQTQRESWWEKVICHVQVSALSSEDEKEITTQISKSSGGLVTTRPILQEMPKGRNKGHQKVRFCAWGYYQESERINYRMRENICKPHIIKGLIFRTKQQKNKQVN